MKVLNIILIVAMIFSMSGMSLASDDRDEQDNSNSAGSALGGAVLGGLLGAGLGAAVGSMSGRAGTGAIIGGGVGALGGTLLAANQAKNAKAQKEAVSREEQAQGAPIPKDAKVKKRVVRQYDEDGNMISEKEIAN